MLKTSLAEEFALKIRENYSARLRFLRDKKDVSYDDGRVYLSPSEDVVVGSFGRWSLTYEVGTSPIPSGGRIRIQLNNSLGANWAFKRLQVDDPSAEGYVSLHISGNARLELVLLRQGLIEVTVVEGVLVEGDKVTIVIGDQASGGPGARVKDYTGEVGFYVSVDRDGVMQDVVEVAKFRVLPGEPVRLSCTLPSIARQGEEVSLIIGALDGKGNVTPYPGNPSFHKLRGSMTEEGERIPLSVGQGRGSDWKRSYAFIPKSPGVIRVCASDKNLEGLSNPLLITETSPEYRLFWGEIHGHSHLSDGLESPDEYYAYGRDCANLDFCALTDHDSWLDEKKWEIIKYVTARYHEPGRFVTFLGFEWSSGQFPDDKCYGHKNVYYIGDNGDFYNHLDSRYETPIQLWEALKPEEALTIAHHPAYPCQEEPYWGTDWSYHDDVMQPLVEIYSKHGISEKNGDTLPLFARRSEGFVQSALARGYRLGFVGGSDTHISWPGSEMWEERRGIRYPKSGLMAVYARKLTREAIFEAMRERRTYATTGARIIVDFKINGHWMGSDIQASGPRVVSAQVIGTAEIKRVDVVRNNVDVYSISGKGDTVEFEWEDREELSKWVLGPDNPFVFYYLRVVQEDGNMAWASPVWVRQILP